MKTMIRTAVPEDSQKLTEISFTSKRYWQYPEAYMKAWEEELTVSVKYIENNEVWVYEQESEPVAYYAITRLASDLKFDGHLLKKGFWLDHMFVSPGCIGSGIGSQLYNHMCEMYGKRKTGKIRVLADPHARGFYQKMGARYRGEFPSSIPGRSTPLMEIILKESE